MSADNVIYVQAKEAGWFVWEQSASVEPEVPNDAKSFTTKRRALEYAHDYMNSDRFIFGVEYGVQLIGGEKDKQIEELEYNLTLPPEKRRHCQGCSLPANIKATEAVVEEMLAYFVHVPDCIFFKDDTKCDCGFIEVSEKVDNLDKDNKTA